VPIPEGGGKERTTADEREKGRASFSGKVPSPGKVRIKRRGGKAHTRGKKENLERSLSNRERTEEKKGAEG